MFERKSNGHPTCVSHQARWSKLALGPSVRRARALGDTLSINTSHARITKWDFNFKGKQMLQKPSSPEMDPSSPVVAMGKIQDPGHKLHEEAITEMHVSPVSGNSYTLPSQFLV